jgi:hypothetical protein
MQVCTMLKAARLLCKCSKQLNVALANASDFIALINADWHKPMDTPKNEVFSHLLYLY